MTAIQSGSPILNGSESNNHVSAVIRIHSVGKRTRSLARDRIKHGLIWLAGLSGAIAIVVTISPFFGWTVVRLASGSMAPSLPTDSLLVTHTVSAASVSVGQIVMVQRPGALPITHRVVSNAPAVGALRTLTLKGDANATTDATPYAVRTVGLVVGGIPWGGEIVAFLRSPIGLGLLTVLATMVVLWAWWPAAGAKGRVRARHAVRATEVKL